MSMETLMIYDKERKKIKYFSLFMLKIKELNFYVIQSKKNTL